MGLLTSRDGVLVRRGRQSVQMNFADLELRGTETTLRQIETRIGNALNSGMAAKAVSYVVPNREFNINCVLRDAPTMRI